MTPTATNTSRPAPSPTAPAGRLILQQGLNGYQGVQDTNIVSWEPDKHFHTFDSLDLRTDDQLAGLFRFDLSAIPPSTIIRRALLQVFALERYGPREIVVGAYRVNRAWTEEGATWNQPWAMAGCNQIHGDRDEFPVSATNMFNVMRWYEFDVTGLVADWVRDPGSNNGVVLKAFGQPSGIKLVTSNHGGTHMRPKLVIE